ncbi:hypothetical protein L6164_026603 [Bauhinia variegata]|uniref:Uncharacterized protein n=1 Tax=Bauhinia variegata TaxID=167791 RepID=A0ACB9LQV2_BAUVA|nr:hypothetical protein L6164_026603 [Bauhinia variegata]
MLRNTCTDAIGRQPAPPYLLMKFRLPRATGRGLIFFLRLLLCLQIARDLLNSGIRQICVLIHLQMEARKYADAFDTHENKYKIDSGRLQEWRRALFEGSSLSGWDSTTFRHESELIEAIVKDLIEKLNYTSSSDEYKKGLVGIDEHIANRIIFLLKGCGLLAEIGLRNLQDKSLVVMSSNDEILMHDLIYKMGEEIVREKSERNRIQYSRLWNPEDIYYIMKYNLGSEAVEGIFLDMSKIEEVRLRPDFFNKMYNLRFLSFRASNDNRSNVLLSEDLHFLPDNLRLLHWERCPLKSLPSTYSPEKLIELNLSHGQLEKLWDGVVNLPNLRSINLSFCKYLAELPNLCEASSLESIDIEDCTSLFLIPSSVFNIGSLTSINARGCQGIRILEVDDRITSIERINFNGCSGLGKFSVISQDATFIDLSGTAIKELPPTFGFCNKLIELHLRDCKSLQHIPDSFSKLECLETLDLSDCQKFDAEALFPAIEGFKSLKILKLDNCLSLSKIPDNLNKLSSLNLLSLSGSSIDSLPPSVKHLHFLKDLALKDCKRLQHLPELPRSIQRLNASSCISLMVMSNLDSNSRHIQDFRSMSKEELLKQYKDGYPEELFLYDCIKLSGKAVNGLLEDAQCRIDRAAFMSSVLDVSQLDDFLIRICLPRGEVPDWFSHQAVESSICCQIPAHSVSDLKLLRFAFCLVIDTSPLGDEDQGKALTLNVGYKCYFAELKLGWIGSSSDLFLTQPSSREHLYIWYDDAFCRYIMYGIADRRNLEITFKFYANINGLNRVKKCGVSVLNKYLNEQSKRARL